MKDKIKITKIERGENLKGSDIKVYLVENGLKQAHIAKKAGIPEPIFCMMLNDKRRIEVNEYMRICDAIGVPLEQFKPPHAGQIRMSTSCNKILKGKENGKTNH